MVSSNRGMSFKQVVDIINGILSRGGFILLQGDLGRRQKEVIVYPFHPSPRKAYETGKLNIYGNHKSRNK